jgi:hypothetical protein
MVVVLGEVWPGSRGWRISLHEVANCFARCEDRTHEGDMVEFGVEGGDKSDRVLYESG